MTASEAEQTVGELRADVREARRQRERIVEALDRLEKSQGELSACLPGLKRMVEDHERRLRHVERATHTRAGAAAAAGGIAGFVVLALSAAAAWLGMKP